MKRTSLLVAFALAIVLAAYLVLRVTQRAGHFENSVRKSLATSEGYDKRFMELVNRLEDVLATRAQFGYSGGKDPMTGRVRSVVKPRPALVRRRTVAKPQAKPEPPDPVRLTAIIADAEGRYTAVMMHGERSLSVDEGDRVAGRRVAAITRDGVVLESADAIYNYDLNGVKSKRPKK